MIVTRKRYEPQLQTEKMINSPVMSSSEPFPHGSISQKNLEGQREIFFLPNISECLNVY